jgi:hypothetical protein
MLRRCALTVALLGGLACDDAGPAPEPDPAGLWRGTISFSAENTQPIQLLIHPIGSTVSILGNISEQVAVTGLATMLPDALVEVGLTVYTPDVPGYHGKLQLAGDELRGRLVSVRAPIDSGTTLSVLRQPITSRNVIGRWVMTSSVRSLRLKPTSIADTLLFTRGGSYSQSRHEVWSEFNYQCSGVGFGAYRVERDSVIAVQHNPPVSGCLVMYRDTLRLAGGSLTRRFRTGVDSIVEVYLKR